MSRLLIAEDDPLTLSGIQLLLARTNYQVAAAVNDGAEALERLPAARPDIMVLDLDMPERSGLDVLRTLRCRGDNRRIVLLTSRINDRNALEAMQLGVNGLVIKAAAPRDLVTCLDAVAQGRRWIDHDVLQRTMDMTLTDSDGGDPLRSLSARERAVAGLVVQGLRNKEVAFELGVTEGTIKVHLHKIFQKLGIGSRTELILLARGKED